MAEYKHIAFDDSPTDLEQAIADLQAWLREDGLNYVEINVEGERVDVWLWSKYGSEARILEPKEGNLDQAITTAITKALNAVRN